LLSLTDLFLAAICGSPWNVEIGRAPYVHHEDAAPHQHNKHRAYDRRSQHAQRRQRKRQSFPSLRNGGTANPGTIENGEAFAGQEME
jgi:hypothetical protein